MRELITSAADEYDLILVDTPGINPFSESQIIDLGEMLSEIPNRFTCLVSPATTKDADLQQAVNALGLFSIKGLVLSKLDETFTYGSLYNLARKNRIPMAYYCTGKEANGSLQYADPSRLVNALFGKGWMK